MRTASSTLKSFLAIANKAVVVDLYTITTKDGSVYRYTTGEFDITHTYLFTRGLLIQRSGIKLTKGIQVDALTLDIFPVNAAIGGIGWLAAVRNGALDGATVKLERLFCSNWETPVEAITLFIGSVGEIEIGRSSAHITVVSMLEKFNVQWPYNVYTPACGWELYGEGCGLSRTSWTRSGSVMEVGTTSKFKSANMAQYGPPQTGIFYSADYKDSASWTYNHNMAYGQFSFGYRDTGEYIEHGYIRFINITIPQGSVVTDAKLRLHTRTCPATQKVNAKIYMNDADNPGYPANAQACDAFALTPGTAWDDVPIWPANIWIDTINIAPELDTVINRDGWSSGNAGIVIFKNINSDVGRNRVAASAYQGWIPELHVAWKSIISGAPPDNYFNQGVIVFTSGLNTGVMRTVKSYLNAFGTISLTIPLPHIPAAGDTFDIYPGCDKLMSTCNTKFNNISNYRGMQFTPAPETAT
jgi:hypothetical protein